jgi:hypothetical protein
MNSETRVRVVMWITLLILGIAEALLIWAINTTS